MRAMGRFEGWGRALWTSFKRPGPVAALEPVTLTGDAIVDPTHVRRYREVCAFQPGQGVPLTYPQLLTFPLLMRYMTSSACPWPAMGTVHLGNDITQHAPIQPGDRLRVRLRTGVCQSHDKGQVFTLSFQIEHADADRLLWQATQTLLRVGVSQPLGAPWRDELTGPNAEGGSALQAVGTFDAAADIGRRYAAVSDDANPIHLWPFTARLLGFPSVLAHGLWSQARALAWLHPDGGPASARLQATFKRPLFLPAQASVWRGPAGGPCADLFEVRDVTGQLPHLRARLCVLQAEVDPS